VSSDTAPPAAAVQAFTMPTDRSMPWLSDMARRKEEAIDHAAAHESPLDRDPKRLRLGGSDAVIPPFKL
jgi:hypothetical protein